MEVVFYGIVAARDSLTKKIKRQKVKSTLLIIQRKRFYKNRRKSTEFHESIIIQLIVSISQTKSLLIKYFCSTLKRMGKMHRVPITFVCFMQVKESLTTHTKMPPLKPTCFGRKGLRNVPPSLYLTVSK